MEDRDLALMAAVILGGMVGGERSSADEKTIKRSIEAAYRLNVLLKEHRETDATAALNKLPPES